MNEKKTLKLLNKRDIRIIWSNGYVYEFYYKSMYVSFVDQGERIVCNAVPVTEEELDTYEIECDNDFTKLVDAFENKMGGDSAYNFYFYDNKMKVKLEAMFNYLDNLHLSDGDTLILKALKILNDECYIKETVLL